MTGNPAWTLDTTQGLQVPRTAAAAQGNLHRALAYPVSPHKEVVGVLESQPLLKSRMLLHWRCLLTIGSQLRQFIGRKQTEDQLRQTEEQFGQAQKMEAVRQFHRWDCP